MTYEYLLSVLTELTGKMSLLRQITFSEKLVAWGGYECCKHDLCILLEATS